ncbi:MAG: tRNA (uridine(54)-C5)-methyltransferase TrmA [Sulfurospirillaceae bacterium]|nr:tRNA (uridine(54)-C5)-methyltransferase TrmA [Sulfurospirillaceae bacterium]MDD3462727.1 tRNA (uridine(54)-C5)-methyltransferase TrmA [Sulfurospirillaceae bacterium]
MECQYFGVCGSCTLYHLDYNRQIEQKKAYIASMFNSLHVENFEVFTSCSSHYRSRAEFRIWHTSEKISYAMHAKEGKGVVCIKECPKTTRAIYDLMEPLRLAIQENKDLSEKLYTIEFLASNKHLLVTMIYHKAIDKTWEDSARELEKKFGIHIIGRSRGLKKVLSQDFIYQDVILSNRTCTYKIIEGGFSQPNAKINENMICWVLSKLKNEKDLLELYCGYGNFTIALSQKFRSVLATEISKVSIYSAIENCAINNVKNIKFLRMSAEELTSALNKERVFNRLKDISLDDYDFSHVFVDPPRSGIDENSLNFISRFETIVYISCNPATLKRDLEFLTLTHNIEDFALFDQFPYTEHIESGAILAKKKCSLL